MQTATDKCVDERQRNEIFPPLSHRTADIYGAMENLFCAAQTLKYI